MINVMKIRKPMHLAQDALYGERQQSALTNREAMLLAQIKARINDVWILIREYETAIEQGDNT